MSKSGGDTGLRIVLPDPIQEDLFHSFSVDPEIVSFLCSVLEDEQIAANIIGWKPFAGAVCGALVQEEILIRVDDEHYRLADDAGRPQQGSVNNDRQAGRHLTPYSARPAPSIAIEWTNGKTVGQHPRGTNNGENEKRSKKTSL